MEMTMTMTNSSTSKIALVLGATGGIGGTLARRLASAGWQIRALNRNAARARQAEPGYQWIQGDAMSADDVARAAAGADLIVHAVNPAGYRNWGELVLPMIDNTIAAACASGATIVLPGTIYNFGPDAFPVLTEESPQNPVTAKGRIRAEMERRLKAATARSARVIIVRAGDFFGPDAANNWFSQGMVQSGKPVRSVIYPGRRGIGHQWAYLPDVAETMARLIERRHELPDFAVYHMEGIWDADGRTLIEMVGRVVGRKPTVWSFPWWSMPLLAPFVPLFRELREMRYLWSTPIRMDNARLVAQLGEEPRTPIETAVRRTLVSMGCLPPDADRAAAQMPLDSVSGAITTPPIR
jgi:nucleoside-diphosphate-sugar epimerase